MFLCFSNLLFEKIFLKSSNSNTFNASSTSGMPDLRSVIPLNRSWSGGVNFNEATAIVAKKGTNSRNDLGFLSVINGNNPIQKIRVTPKGSTKALGNSGKVSAFHKYGKATLPALLNFLVKYL